MRSVVLLALREMWRPGMRREGCGGQAGM